jgi:hypothetical protein
MRALEIGRPQRGPSSPDKIASVNASKITWLVTVAICAIAAIVLVLNGYTGYSITVGAVGLAAAVNLRGA